MPSLLRFAILHFAAGMAIGIALAATLVFSDVGFFSSLRTPEDRLLGFAMLAVNLGLSFGIACLGTGLCFAAEDD